MFETSGGGDTSDLAEGEQVEGDSEVVSLLTFSRGNALDHRAARRWKLEIYLLTLQVL